MIHLQIAGLDAIETRLQELPKKIEGKVLRHFADFVHEKALDRADKHTKTGALFQSLYSRPIPHGYEIGNDPQRAPHAVFVHWGTKPHVIKPKKRKALRWSSGGEFAFAKRVNHPGYIGDPYLVLAARDAIRNFDSIVQQATKGL